MVAWLFLHPALVLCATLFPTALAGYAALNVEREQSIEVWFLPDDPDLLAYNRFTENFRSDEIFVIGVFADDLFELATWESIEQLAERVGELPFVYRVMTPGSIGNLDPYSDGDFAPGLREQALSNSILQGTFIAHDASAAAIVVQLTREGNNFANKRHLVDALNDLLKNDPLAQSLNVRVAGTPISDDASMRHNEHDMTRVVPMMIVMIIFVAWLIFRRPLFALLPLAVVLLASVWMFGFMGFLGYKFTLVSSALLPLVLAVGVADSIHLLAQYRRQAQQGKTVHDAVVDATSRVFVACFFTSATTAAGLLALLVSHLQPIREFAVVASFGVITAFILSILIVPAALLLSKAPARGGHTDSGRWLTEWLSKVGAMSVAVSRTVLFVAAIILVLSAVSATRMEVGVNPMAWFKADEPVRVNTELIDETFGGSLSVEFLVTGPDGALRDRAVLQEIEDFQGWLERETIVARVLSIVDVLKEIGRTGQIEEDALPRLPNERALERLFAGMDKNREVRHWVNATYDEARLSGRIPLTQASSAVDQIPIIEGEIERRFADTDLEVRITGYANLMVKMQLYTLDSQIKSLALAFATVTVLIGLLLRSATLAAIAMIPNLVPITVGLGCMTLLGIGLNPGSVMVGAIMLGIVVDDTVHFLVALRRRLDTDTELDVAVRDTVKEVGTPVVVTSLILALGFASLYFGDFGPSRDVGQITAVVITVALLADLVLLPAVLRFIPSFADITTVLRRKETPGEAP